MREDSVNNFVVVLLVVFISAITLWTLSAMLFTGPLAFLDGTQPQP